LINPLLKVRAIFENDAKLARDISALPGAKKITRQAIHQWRYIPASRAIDIFRVTENVITVTEILEFARYWESKMRRMKHGGQ
jgi:hypothetical protein